MHFSSCQPLPLLSGFVDSFWLYEGYEAEHKNERILPSGTVELVVNLLEDELRIYKTDEAGECSRYSGAVVSGTYRNGFLSDTEEESFIMGVHFKPGGSFPFLGLPANELAGSHVDLATLWGRSAGRLREQLCEQKSVEKRFNLLQSALIDNLFRPMENHYAVETALDTLERRPNISIREIAKDAGLSQRRLIEVFKAEVGMTPKLFSRIQRFQLARKVIEQTTSPDWAILAADFGYFDQSHMIREFNEFSGTPPESYLRQFEQIVDQRLHVKNNHLPCL